MSLDVQMLTVGPIAENCFIVPFLTEVFPDAVFLHVYRDGRDVAWSIYNHHASARPATKASASGHALAHPFNRLDEAERMRQAVTRQATRAG